MKYFLILALVVIVPLIAFTIYNQVVGVDREIDELINVNLPSPQSHSDSSANLFDDSAFPLENYGALADNNLFHPERKSIEPDQAESPPETIEDEKPPVGPPSSIAVLGIILIGDATRYAYMTNQDDQKKGMKRYNQGEMIGDYEIIEILADRVKLKAGDETSILKLATSSPRKGAQTPRQARAAARNRPQDQGQMNPTLNQPPGMSQFNEQNPSPEQEEAQKRRALARERMRNRQEQMQEEIPPGFESQGDVPFNQPPEFFNPAFDKAEPESFADPLPWEGQISGSDSTGSGVSGRRFR